MLGARAGYRVQRGVLGVLGDGGDGDDDGDDAGDGEQGARDNSAGGMAAHNSRGRTAVVCAPGLCRDKRPDGRLWGRARWEGPAGSLRPPLWT